MRLAVPMFGVVASTGSAKAGEAVQPTVLPEVAQEPWSSCWPSQHVAELCCNGAWGGSGCWEEGRSFETCCTPPGLRPSPAPLVDTTLRASSSSCSERIKRVAAVLSSERIASELAAPVEAKVRESLHSFANFTGPHSRQRLLAPYLTGLAPFEKEMLLALLAIVAGALEARGITFWLNGAALLGALRHYGPQPWAESLSLAAFASTADDITAALLAGARAVRDSPTAALGTFGPVVITPTGLAPKCRGSCGRWEISFARSLTFRAASPEAGPRLPSVEVNWLDVRGESHGWRHLYGDPLPLSHREVLAMALPVVRGRPFAHLRLPIPRHAWKLLEALAGGRGQVQPWQVCQTSRSSLQDNQGAETLPCAAVAAMFPMVLQRQSFGSAKDLVGTLGLKGALALRRNAIAAASSGSGRSALSLSVEVSVDTVRGASALLIAEETGGGSEGGPWTCWHSIHGSHDLVMH